LTKIKIESLYVPPDCIQGDTFPAHVRWKAEEPIAVKLFLPEAIEPKEIYNVRPGGFVFEQNTLTIKQFEVDGYLGLVLKSKIYETPSVKESIKIVLEDRTGTEETTKEIYLFRPDIRILNKPETVTTLHESKGERLFDDAIQVKNAGDGTAIINLRTKEESKILKKNPQEIEQFVTKFLNNLEKNLNQLKSIFPAYSETLDEFLEFVKKPDLTKESLTTAKVVISKIYDIVTKDEEFLQEFAESLAGSYLSSLQVITEITPLVEYLKSLATSRILLLDSMSILEIPTGSNDFCAEMDVTDFALNAYPSCDVSLKIRNERKEPIRVPLYSLFKFIH